MKDILYTGCIVFTNIMRARLNAVTAGILASIHPPMGAEVMQYMQNCFPASFSLCSVFIRYIRTVRTFAPYI